MIKEAIVKIVNKEDLSYEEAYAVMNEIMDGETTPTQNAAFLAALSTKSTRAETTAEIAGCAQAMREHVLKVNPGYDVLEIVGTGGDNAGSFNISTTAGLVAAAGGVKVAKHGNRAASSKSGAADCLEALGANIDQVPAHAEKMLDEAGMCFFFAQKYHSSMKYVGAIRRELGFRTVFNILGPLTNPASPTQQLLGVYEEHLVEPLANVLMELGVKRGMVVFGLDKLDEISLSAPTKICEFQNGWYKTSVIQPEDFGMTRCTKEDLLGGTPEENAQITRDILAGKERGPKRDAVLLNAGAALYIAEKAESLAAGVALAGELIDSGAATATLEKFIQLSNAVEAGASETGASETAATETGAGETETATTEAGAQ
ncbi:MAG: anthranilate phosphoribosyltransferase [Arcanobacterium sp.]|nr:anthranilate phosphoribosyltransferase [Arcanobacterium sp.]